MIRRSHLAAAMLAALLVAPTPGVAQAATERVAYPEGFATGFVRFDTRDKPDRKITRFFYMDRESHARATPGEPLPHGTIVVMEDHKVRMAGEQPVTDAQGRFIPTDTVSNVFVMQKGAGWGSEYADDTRNGEWEYAWFDPAGQRRADKSMDGCFQCHKAQAAKDFTFLTFDYLLQR